AAPVAVGSPGRAWKARADLRLYGCAGSIWLTSLAGLYASARTGVLVAVVAALLAAVLAWRLRAGLVLAVLLGVVCGAASTAAGAAPWSRRAAGALRSGLRRACEGLPPGPGGLLPGLVDGDTSRLDPGVAEDFRATGMTHLTAVSGANLAIVGGLVLALVRWC